MLWDNTLETKHNLLDKMDFMFWWILELTHLMDAAIYFLQLPVTNCIGCSLFYEWSLSSITQSVQQIMAVKYASQSALLMGLEMTMAV